MNQTIVSNIRRFISEDPVLAAKVEFVKKILTQPVLTEDMTHAHVCVGTSNKRDFTVTTTSFVNKNNPNVADHYICMEALQHDESFTDSEIIGLWYWPVSQIDIAAYRFITVIEADGKFDDTFIEALTHNAITGEPITITQPLDEPEKELEDA